MKKIHLIKSLIAAASLLTIISCAQNTQSKSSQESSNISSSASKDHQISSSSYNDPNILFVPTIGSIHQKLNSKFSVLVEYETSETHGEINFTNYGQYTKFEDSSKEEINCFVKNDSGQGYYYTKDDDGHYSSFTCEEFNLGKYYRSACIGLVTGVYKFKSNQNITFLGRECIKYSNKEEINDSIQDSLILDKETGIILYLDLDELTQEWADDITGITVKFEVKRLLLGDEVKDIISEDIENIYAHPLDAATLENLGFYGELETPHFAINTCSTKWNNKALNEYRIEYKERVNSGNDTYINQFETFTTCLYNMGFNKSSLDASSNSSYKDLVIDSTIDYDADISFNAFANKYKAESNLTVKGGQASIVFVLTYIS